jgi:hypothetical protein
VDIVVEENSWYAVLKTQSSLMVVRSMLGMVRLLIARAAEGCLTPPLQGCLRLEKLGW